MNKTHLSAAGALLALVAYSSPTLAADVGVSLNVGQPGFYGQINIGDAPRPRIIYAQPVVIERQLVRQEPIYLHVRPGHARNWKGHCHEYSACGQRVYFVNDNWYNTVYVDHHRQRYEQDQRRHHEARARSVNNEYGRRDGDRHDGEEYGTYGPGRGNGNGNGNGNGQRRH